MPNEVITRRAALAGAAAAALACRTARAAAPDAVNVGFFTETKPTMIAKGEGWFDEGAGAKLTWTEMGGGTDINAAIADGGCDIALSIGSVAAASGIAQGVPFKVIGVVDDIGPAEEMTVRVASAITAPQDFVGKKVGTPFGSTSHFRLLGFLKTNGLSPRDVTVLDMKPPEIVSAWSRGDIDAAYVWAPARSRIMEDGGVAYKTYDTLDAAGYVTADLIVVRDGFAAEHPDAVTGFIKAYGRALAMYRSKPEAAATIVAAQAGVTQAIALADMREYRFIPLAEQAGPDWLGGAPDQPGAFARVLKGTADFLVEQGGIKSAPPVETFQAAIDTRYLVAASA